MFLTENGSKCVVLSVFISTFVLNMFAYESKGKK